MFLLSKQGSSVVNHLLQNKDYQIRILTRKPDSENAIEFAKKGIEVIKGDLRDKESLRKFLSNANSCFLVTNFWEHPENPNYELDCGKNFADVAKECKVQHLIFRLV